MKQRYQPVSISARPGQLVSIWQPAAAAAQSAERTLVLEREGRSPTSVDVEHGGHRVCLLSCRCATDCDANDIDAASWKRGGREGAERERPQSLLPRVARARVLPNRGVDGQLGSPHCSHVRHTPPFQLLCAGPAGSPRRTIYTFDTSTASDRLTTVVNQL